MTYRGTRIVFVEWVSLRRRGVTQTVAYYHVVAKDSERVCFGPGSWRECCAFKQGLPGSPKRKL